jgi:hypothetical protein
MVPNMMIEFGFITASLSLIEFIYVDDFDDFSFIGNKIVSIQDENWVLYRIITNHRTKRRSSFEKKH